MDAVNFVVVHPARKDLGVDVRVNRSRPDCPPPATRSAGEAVVARFSPAHTNALGERVQEKPDNHCVYQILNAARVPLNRP